jgi:C4-dicarboxylate transporter DctM subunit
VSGTADGVTATPGGSVFARAVSRIEDLALAGVLLAGTLVPLVEILLRAAVGDGIENAANLVQHATLVAGMTGAAVAAREGRLLTFGAALPVQGRAGRWGRLAGGCVAALLAASAWDFVEAERASGSVLVRGLPLWTVQSVLPAGFALIAWRIIVHAAPGRAARAGAFVAVLAVAWLAYTGRVDVGAHAPAVACAVLVAAALGAPAFVAIGGCAMALLLSEGVPAAALAVNHYGLVSNPTLPAIPMFTLAGYLLAQSRAPSRLLDLFDAWFGRLRGGAAVAAVLAATFFTCFTGASGVAILTLGGLLMPLLVGQGFPERRALGLVTAAGLPGVILMPSLPLLLYAVVAGLGIEQMFMAGLVPALLMMAAVSVWGVLVQPRQLPGARAPFSWPRALGTLWVAKWELSLPLVPIVALATALATPVEAAAFTVAYAAVVVTLIHRDLRVTTDLPRIAVECGVMVGGILLVLGVAMSLANYFVDAEIPLRIASWVTEHTRERWVFLLALNATLFAAGCVMDIYTAIVVLVPLVAPLGAAFGIHPAHLGVIFLANLEIGYLTPPVGMNLFFASYRFGKPIGEVFAAVAPLFVWLVGALILITYVPWLTTGMLGAHG